MSLNLLLDTLLNRDDGVHKGQCGRVAVVAGVSGAFGALYLAGLGAFRAGAGVVHGLSCYGIKEILVDLPEIQLHECVENPNFQADIFNQTLTGINPHVVAIGPGLGRDKVANDCLEQCLAFVSKLTLPFVCDADGLRCVQVAQLKANASQSGVITPHEAEFLHLFPDLSCTADQREQSALEAASLCGQVVVLKGHKTVVSDGKDVYVNTTGNAGMATAGSGDVLTGIIAAFMGQGLSSYEAACCGVYVHGLAGDKAFDDHRIGLMASDIAQCISAVFKDLERVI